MTARRSSRAAAFLAAIPIAWGLLAFDATVLAAAASRPVVVELFTSQACSDCPPAETLLRRLQASHPGILTLALHVTYFNGPGWRDPFSSHAATARQTWYAALLGHAQIFTPQAVIDGHASAVGSDRRAILRDIRSASAAAARPAVQVSITPNHGGWRVALTGQPATGQRAASQRAAGLATIELFRFDAIDQTAVRGGENGGRRLVEIHVVRAIVSLGTWTGRPMTEQIAPGVGQHIAVLVQQTNGTILGAASA